MESIAGICRIIKQEAYESLEACKIYTNLINDNLLLNQLHLETTTQMFTNSAKTEPEKQACEFTFSYLTNIKDNLNSLTIKTG